MGNELSCTKTKKTKRMLKKQNKTVSTKKRDTQKEKKEGDDERERGGLYFTPLLIKFWTSKIQNKARVVCGERTNKRTREDVLETLEAGDVFVDGE